MASKLGIEWEPWRVARDKPDRRWYVRRAAVDMAWLVQWRGPFLSHHVARRRCALLALSGEDPK